jgi:hypothetical protein
MKRALFSLAAVWLPLAFCLNVAAAQENLVFACATNNDLFKVVCARQACPRYETPSEAVHAAANGAGVLILADQYPEKTTVLTPEAWDEAARKQLRIYLEYPETLPGCEIGKPQQDPLMRGVVVSDFFGGELPPLRIVTINGCRFVPAKAERSHLVLAKVAGVNTAVFGLKDTPTTPLLFETGNRLVATTQLSRFIAGRYMPEEAWRNIWQKILGWLRQDSPPLSLQWTATVRPSFGRQEPLPADVEARALRRSADWIIRSRILRHAQWPQAALDWAVKYNTVRDMPAPDWPAGDGSWGLLEGFSSTIRADGSQPMRYAVRNDCLCETAMLLAFHATAGARPSDGLIASNLLHYLFTNSGLAAGPREEPKNPAYGLIGWALDSPNNYWGDDNGRALLGLLAVSALQTNAQWPDRVARNLIANLRLSGPNGHRPRCLTQADLDQQGWKHYWQLKIEENTPHMTAWLWPGFLWAYEKTRLEPFLARSEAGCRTLMTAYPNWDYVNGSGTIELARALLPLAWLVRVRDTPEHRQWLRHLAGDLIALQDESGALRESLRAGQGPYRNGIPQSNADYGTRETSLIQEDSDTVADLLYTCNFAFIGLHEAAAATGDRFYAEAEEKLAQFLCRIQIRSETHPELDGAWYRAFNFGDWQYWASNADWEWGPWCTETGWTQPWIASTFALRQMKTSLWTVALKSPLSAHFTSWYREMIPDQN